MTADVSHTITSAFLGVSIGQSYYSRQRINNYLSWAEINYESFAFLIGDFVYRFTLAGLKGLPLDEAMFRSLQIGHEMAVMLTDLSEQARVSVTLLRWADVATMPQHVSLLHVINDASQRNMDFQAAIRNQVWLNLGNRVHELGVPEDPTVHNNVSQLFDSYIKEELAGLIAVSEYTQFHTEIYPGRDLRILENIYEDMYPEISAVLPKDRKRQFVRMYIE